MFASVTLELTTCSTLASQRVLTEGPVQSTVTRLKTSVCAETPQLCLFAATRTAWQLQDSDILLGIPVDTSGDCDHHAILLHGLLHPTHALHMLLLPYSWHLTKLSV